MFIRVNLCQVYRQKQKSGEVNRALLDMSVIKQKETAEDEDPANAAARSGTEMRRSAKDTSDQEPTSKMEGHLANWGA